MNELEKEYIKLSKKYNLPDFKEINEEFEIGDLENASFLLKNILRKIAEKLEFYSNLINDVMQPDTSSLSSMYETRFFSDSDKNNMYSLFKNIMKSYRNIIELVLENNEKKQAEFLKKFFSEWFEIKKQLINYLGKMKDSWEKETTVKEDLEYFG